MVLDCAIYNRNNHWHKGWYSDMSQLWIEESTMNWIVSFQKFHDPLVIAVCIRIRGLSMIEPVRRRVQIRMVYKQTSHDGCETQIPIHPLIWELKRVTRWTTWGREGEGVHLNMNWCCMLRNTWYTGMVVGRNFNVDLWYEQCWCGEQMSGYAWGTIASVVGAEGAWMR